MHDHRPGGWPTTWPDLARTWPTTWPTTWPDLAHTWPTGQVMGQVRPHDPVAFRPARSTPNTLDLEVSGCDQRRNGSLERGPRKP